MIRCQDSKSFQNGSIERDLFSITEHLNSGTNKRIHKEFHYNALRRSFRLNKTTKKK